MKCTHCSVPLPSYNAYKMHCGISHTTKGCICPVTGCTRSYLDWRTLDAHFKKCPAKSAVLASATVTQPSCSSVAAAPAEHISEPVDSSVPEKCPVQMPQLPTLKDNLCSMREKADAFVSGLYGKPRLPREYVQNIIQDVTAFICDGLVSNLRTSVLSVLQENDVSPVTKVFAQFETPFKHLSSEYLRFKYFMENGEYIPPVSYEIGEINVPVESGRAGEPLFKKKKCYGQSAPLDKMLKQFLEVPHVLDEILNHVKMLESNNDNIQNFMQCKLWKKKVEKFPEDAIVLPLHSYYDEFEVNNPLGSHCEKLGGAYVQIACMPPECMSNTDDIFLALVFNSEYRCFSDEKAFAPLISQLTDLYNTGILVNTSNGEKRVFFVSGLLLGDNLGLNSVGGFVESFQAHHFCRFCTTHKDVTTSQSVEDEDSIRTKESIGQDLIVNNKSLTGVKSECSFNTVPSFNIAENFSVDCFHDFNEGVCHYTMIHILSHCIPKYFTVDTLNHRMEFFIFGPCDSNKFPLLSDDFKKRDKLKMSGSETLLFVKMFGLLIGEMVPHDDEFWGLYLKLRELLDICLAPSVSCRQSVSLKVLVEEFNLMYVNVTKDTLKPKFHNLVHYPRILEESGPFAWTSTKSFERKHRSLTVPAHATQSRRNIALTVAIQHQLTMCHKFRCRKSLVPAIEFGPTYEVLLSDFKNKNFVDSLLKFNLPLTCVACDWLEYKRFRYKLGMVLVLNVNDGGCPRFGVIESILLRNENDCVFVYSYLLCTGFDDHVHAYAVEYCDKWGCISPCDVLEPLPLSIHFSYEAKKYIVLRYSL